MNRKHFCNALDNYIINDQMQSAVKLISKAAQFKVSTVLNILSTVEDTIRLKPSKLTLGKLIYNEILNSSSKYQYTITGMKYRIRKFNFTRHFEDI